MADPNPKQTHGETVLSAIEAVATVVGTIDGIKVGLEDRGWDSVQAQATARTAYDNLMKTYIAELQAGLGRPEGR